MKTYRAVFIDDLTGEELSLLEWQRPVFTRREFKHLLAALSFFTLTVKMNKVRCYLYCGSRCVHEFIAVRYAVGALQPFVHILACRGLDVRVYRTMGRLVR